MTFMDDGLIFGGQKMKFANLHASRTFLSYVPYVPPCILYVLSACAPYLRALCALKSFNDGSVIHQKNFIFQRLLKAPFS